MAQGSSQSKENMLCPHRGVSFWENESMLREGE